MSRTMRRDEVVARLEAMPVGTKVRVVFEATVEERELPRPAYAYGLPRKRKTLAIGGTNLTPAQTAHAVEFEQIVPAWQPGDVVVVKFTPTGTPYTYVRGMHSWPGEYAANKVDCEIDDLFREGKATHVLRDGKPVEVSSVVPF